MEKCKLLFHTHNLSNGKFLLILKILLNHSEDMLHGLKSWFNKNAISLENKNITT